MEQTQVEVEAQKEETKIKAELESKHSLKGTFVSVMSIGVFIVVLWVGIFFLFLSRG